MLLGTERGLPPSALLTEHYIGRSGSGFADYFAQNVREGMDFTSINLAKRFGRTVMAKVEADPEDVARQLTREEYEAGPFARKAIPYRPGMTAIDARVNAEGHDERQLRQLFMGQYTGDHELAGALAGQLVGGIAAPENLISLPGAMYLTTGMRAGQAMAQAGKVAAAENVLVTLGMAPALSQALEAEGTKYGFEEAVQDVATAAGAGFVLGASFKGVGIAADKIRLRTAQKLADAESKLSGGLHGLADSLEDSGEFRGPKPQAPKSSEGWFKQATDRVKSFLSPKPDALADGTRPVSEVTQPSWRKPVQAGESAPTRPAASQEASTVTRAMRDLEAKMTKAGETLDTSGIGEAIYGLRQSIKGLSKRIETMDRSQLEAMKELRIMQSRLQYILDNPDAPARVVEKPAKGQEHLADVMRMEPQERAQMAQELSQKVEAHQEAVEAHKIDLDETRAVLADAEPKAAEQVKVAEAVKAAADERVPHKIPTKDGEHVLVYVEREKLDAVKAAKEQYAHYQQWLGEGRYIAKNTLTGEVTIVEKPKRAREYQRVTDGSLLEKPWVVYEGDRGFDAVAGGVLGAADYRKALKQIGWSTPEIRMVAVALKDSLPGSLGIMYHPEKGAFIANERVLGDHEVFGWMADEKARGDAGWIFAKDVAGIQGYLESLPGIPSYQQFYDMKARYTYEFAAAKDAWFVRHINGMIDSYMASDTAAYDKFLSDFTKYFAHNLGDPSDPDVKAAVARIKKVINKATRDFTKEHGKAVAAMQSSAVKTPDPKLVREGVRNEYIKSVRSLVERYYTTADSREDDIIAHVVDHIKKNSDLHVTDAIDRLPPLKGIDAQGLEIAEQIDIPVPLVRELERAQLEFYDRDQDARFLEKVKADSEYRKVETQKLMVGMARNDVARAIIGALQQLSNEAKAAAVLDLMGAKPGTPALDLPKRKDVREWVEALRALKAKGKLGGEDFAVFSERALYHFGTLDGMIATGKSVVGPGKGGASMDAVALAESAVDTLRGKRRETALDKADAERALNQPSNLDSGVPDTIGKPHYVEGMFYDAKNDSWVRREMNYDEALARLSEVEDQIDWLKSKLDAFERSGEKPWDVVAERTLLDGQILEPGMEIHPDEMGRAVAVAQKASKGKPLVMKYNDFVASRIDMNEAEQFRIHASMDSYGQGAPRLTEGVPAWGSVSSLAIATPGYELKGAMPGVHDKAWVADSIKRQNDRLDGVRKQLMSEGVLDKGGRRIDLVDRPAAKSTAERDRQTETARAMQREEMRVRNAALAPQVDLSVRTIAADAIDSVTKKGGC